MYFALGYGDLDKLHPTVVAMMDYLLVFFGSLTLGRHVGERTGWDILIWIGTLDLVWLAFLVKLGVVAVFANFVSQHLALIGFWASFIISAAFCTLNTSLLSGTARIAAIILSAFAAILVAMGAPIPFTILPFGFDE